MFFMQNAEIGVRSLDIQSGLYRFNDSLIDIKLRKTTSIGKAASLATHLRGLQVIENYDGLIALASKLGISAIELESILSTLDEIEYVRVIGSKQNPDRVEVLLSNFQTTYERLGEQWELSNPAEFEQKMVSIISKLSSEAIHKNQFNTTYDLNEAESSLIMDLGTQGGLIGSYSNPSTGYEMFYSPIYMEENPQDVISLISKFPDKDVKKTFELLKSFPGYPVFNLNNINNDILLEMMTSNIYQTPAIDASGGRVNFMFSPFTDSQDRQMLKHARFVVAAVRYGEKFSAYGHLRNPAQFLDSLLTRGYIGRNPHSDIEAQYGVLRDCGLGKIIEVMPGRFRFYLSESEYAHNVVELAKKILFSQTDFDPEMARGIVEEAWSERGNLSSYEFTGYIPNLTNINNVRRALSEKQPLNRSQSSQRIINLTLNTLFNGGEPDVF